MRRIAQGLYQAPTRHFYLEPDLNLLLVIPDVSCLLTIRCRDSTRSLSNRVFLSGRPSQTLPKRWLTARTHHPGKWVPGYCRQRGCFFAFLFFFSQLAYEVKIGGRTADRSEDDSTAAGETIVAVVTEFQGRWAQELYIG